MRSLLFIVLAIVSTNCFAETPKVVEGLIYPRTSTNSAFTLGSIPFVGTGGATSQDNGNLFWDATNFRLGIGTNSPAQKLSVVGVVESTSGGFEFPDATTQTTAAVSPAIGGPITSATDGSLLFVGSGAFDQDNSNIFWDNAGKFLGIGTSSPDAKIDVQGTSDEVQARITGNSSQTADTFRVEKSSGANLMSVSEPEGVVMNDSAGIERFKIITADFNMAVGTPAASSGATGISAFGVDALVNVTGNNNTGVGNSAGSILTTGASNTIVGSAADVETSGTSEAVIVGRGAIGADRSVVVGELARSGTGDHNLSVGTGAGHATASGADNSILGTLSGRQITTGRRNTIVGAFAGNILTSGEENLVLGYLADVPATASNTAVFGYYGMTEFTFGTDNGTDPFSSPTPTRTVRSGNAFGTDQAAGDFVIQGSRSTGTGTGGDIVLAAAPAAGSTSSSLNGVVERVRLDADTGVTTLNNLQVGTSIAGDPGFFKATAAGIGSCDTACGTSPAGFATGSTACDRAWELSTSTIITCNDTTSVNKSCLCVGIR